MDNLRRRERREKRRFWLTVAGLIGGFVFLLWVGNILVPESRAINAASDLGFTDVQIIDRSWGLFTGCGKGDTVRFTVRATNTKDEVREFYVCAGPFKGGTYRSK